MAVTRSNTTLVIVKASFALAVLVLALVVMAMASGCQAGQARSDTQVTPGKSSAEATHQEKRPVVRRKKSTTITVRPATPPAKSPVRGGRDKP